MLLFVPKTRHARWNSDWTVGCMPFVASPCRYHEPETSTTSSRPSTADCVTKLISGVHNSVCCGYLSPNRDIRGETWVLGSCLQCSLTTFGRSTGTYVSPLARSKNNGPGFHPGDCGSICANHSYHIIDNTNKPRNRNLSSV